ncbi:MAG TPA: ATP-binding protein [Terracidiphilus sp.]|nr:ATP-binding protein [Terracidiphilus sp.]
MPESFHVPAFLLTVLMLPAFAQLYRRQRDTRALLWMLGFLFAVLHMLQAYRLGLWDFTDPRLHPWATAAGLSCALISAVLFLASFSPAGFRIRGHRILYAVPFAIPLVAYAILYDGVYHGDVPAQVWLILFPSLGALSLLIGCFWAYSRRAMPAWLTLTLFIFLGGAGFRICVTVGGPWPLIFAESALHLTAGLLIFYASRRLTPGTVLSGLGFFVWSFALWDMLSLVTSSRPPLPGILYIAALGPVLAAIGIFLLALEDEVALMRAASQREHRARTELEAYTAITLSRRRLEDFDRQAPLICQTIVDNSRFAQVALLLRPTVGPFRLAGVAGLDEPARNALEALAGRLPVTGFPPPGSASPIVEGGLSVRLNFEPWLLPGDDLERLGLTQILATPLYGDSSLDGLFLLMDVREPEHPLRSDDMIPVEVFAARVQSSRSQTQMFEKLVDAEKFAGLGQLAGSVARQLNNPLTVILGYASLLEASQSMTTQERRGVEAILAEARNMRSTLESLSRMSHTQGENFNAISVTELLSDIERLHRSEFVHRGIDFRLHADPTLPRALGNAQQVRQAVLYCLQFAMEAVDNLASSAEKSVRIDASVETDHVRILIAHSGPGFLHPTRAFDPFVPMQAAGETAGLGLSLCATILRENNGRISAVNKEPRGATIILELKAA